MDKTIKIKPAKATQNAKKTAKDKIEESLSKMQNITVSDIPLRIQEQVREQIEEEVDDQEAMAPARQPDSELPEVQTIEQVADKSADASAADGNDIGYWTRIETIIVTAITGYFTKKDEERDERVRKMKALGIDVITPDNALTKCTEFIGQIRDTYNLFKKQDSTAIQELANGLATAKIHNDTAKRLETVIGKIENVQGVKAPKRPPFPSWACLAYLLWHWPMYAFSWLWLSKYFRRFCFLITFLVIVVETCLIGLLASENSTMHLDRAKYYTVRNWSYVLQDTSAVNRFNRVDVLFEDTKFHREQINDLQEFIRTKHEQNLKQHRY